MFSCFKNCFNNFGLVTTHHEPRKEENLIGLDTKNAGNLKIFYFYHFFISFIILISQFFFKLYYHNYNLKYFYFHVYKNFCITIIHCNYFNGFVGQEVVVVKNCSRVCGRGAVLGSAPLVQSKSYFEVKIQQDGVWGVGIATRSTNLETAIGGMDIESWALNSDGTIKHNKEELHKVQNLAQEGDIIVIIIIFIEFSLIKVINLYYFCHFQGISYDHIELNFYLNGKSLEAPVMGIKGTTYPVLYGKSLFFVEINVLSI